MKKRLQEIKHQLMDYWRQRSKDSDSKRMSRGAEYLSRIITWARGENWRKNHPKNEHKFQHHKDKHKKH